MEFFKTGFWVFEFFCVFILYFVYDFHNNSDYMHITTQRKW